MEVKSMNQYGYHPTQIVVRMNKGHHGLNAPTTSYDVYVQHGDLESPLLYMNVSAVRLIRLLESLTFQLPIQVEEIPKLFSSTQPLLG
jgi:hypothetical protein